MEQYFLDVAFLVNFLMDYLLLWLVRAWRGRISEKRRIAAAAAFGALCSCLPVFFRLEGVMAVLYALACAAVMCMVAFGGHKRAFLKNYFTLLFLTFVAGGMLYSFCLTFYGHSMERDGRLEVPSVVLVLLAVPSILLFFLARFVYREEKKQLIYPVRLVLFGQQFECQGLFDTGNCLYDPFYGKPVVIFTDEAIYHTMQEKLAEEPEKTRFVPFCSVGKKQGMLAGAELTELVIWTEEGEVCRKDVIAVYAGSSFPRKEYQVILHPDLV